MGVKPQEVNLIINLKHNTKIDTVDHAMKALGKNLQLTVA